MKLSDLKPGESALVTKVEGIGAIHRRLLSMGILPGTVIRMVRVSPLGDPIAYEIRGVFISLRREEAEYIEVEKIVPLNLVPAEERVRVILVDGGPGFMRNLSEMGITPGKSIEILRTCCPMTVRTQLGVFQVGLGIASRVFVR